MDEAMETIATDETDGKGPLIFGRVLDGKGGARPIERDEVDHDHAHNEKYDNRKDLGRRRDRIGDRG